MRPPELLGSMPLAYGESIPPRKNVTIHRKNKKHGPKSKEHQKYLRGEKPRSRARKTPPLRYYPALLTTPQPPRGTGARLERKILFFHINTKHAAKLKEN